MIEEMFLINGNLNDVMNFVWLVKYIGILKNIYS